MDLHNARLIRLSQAISIRGTPDLRVWDSNPMKLRMNLFWLSEPGENEAPDKNVSCLYSTKKEALYKNFDSQLDLKPMELRMKLFWLAECNQSEALNQNFDLRLRFEPDEASNEVILVDCIRTQRSCE